MAISKEELRIQLKVAGVSHSKAQLKSLHGAVNKTGAGMGKMAGQIAMATAGFYAASKAIGSVISTGKEFQQSMANVRAISGATGKEFDMLQQSAKNLGATTVFTASQVAELQTEFAKLGFTATEITKVTEGTLALSSAVGADLATSAAVAGTTLRGFGLDVAETSRVTDVMALSFSSSALDMDKFANSMQYVAPIAKSAGMDLEGTTAILGQLANAGISGSMAGTSLRKILLEAGNAGSKLAKKMGGPITSFEDFQAKLAKLKADGLDPISEGTDLVGKRAVSAFEILLNGIGPVNELGMAFNSAGGAAQEMADVQLDTLEGALKLATSAMDGLKIEIFETAEGPLKDLVEGFTAFIESLDAETVNSYAAGIAAAAVSMGIYNTAMALARIRTLGLAAAMASTPWGVIAVGASLVAGKLLHMSGVFDVAVTEEEKAAELALQHNKALEEQAAAITNLTKEYDVLNEAQAQAEYDDLNNQLNEAGMQYAQLNEKLAEQNHKLKFNSNLKEEEKDNLEDMIAMNENFLAVVSEEIELRGLEFAALGEIIQKYKDLKEAKEGVGGSEGAEGVSNPYEVFTDDSEISNALNTLSNFYMAANELKVDQLAIDEATMIAAAEAAAGFEGASQEEIAAIQDVFDKKREKSKDALEKSDRARQARSVSNTLGNLAAANKAFGGSADTQKAILGAQALMNTYSSATAAYNSVVGIPVVGPGLAVAAAASAIAAGLANVRMIEQTPTKQMAEGGLISGPLHSGGGVNINAEGGEFVMRRDAVDSVGLETMNAINEGESTGTTNITFSGNVMSQDFIEDEAIPMIKEAIRRGATLGEA